MDVSVVDTRSDPRLLNELRQSLGEAEDVLCTVAFANSAGVNLVFNGLGRPAESRTRLMVTTVFGQTKPAALDRARGHGAQVRLLNPSSGTFHPKLYLSRKGSESIVMMRAGALFEATLRSLSEASAFRSERSTRVSRERNGPARRGKTVCRGERPAPRHPRLPLASATAGATSPGRMPISQTFGPPHFRASCPASWLRRRPQFLCPGPRLLPSISTPALMIGSANLTGGLVNNYETASVMRGQRDEGPIARAWELAEAYWHDPQATDWTPTEVTAEEEFSPDLLALLQAEVARDPVFMTLGASPRRNVVTQLTPTGAYVETDASLEKGKPPQLVPAWMIELAWDYLHAHGELSNSHLLNVLRVHRSSAVCALLARLPGVRVRRTQGIVLEWRPLRGK